MAVKMQYRKKKSWTLETLYIELDSPDHEILPKDNHLSGSLKVHFRVFLTERKFASSLGVT